MLLALRKRYGANSQVPPQEGPQQGSGHGQYMLDIQALG